MAGVEWQCHETEQLKSLFDDNKSLEEIVEASGRTRNAVGRKLRMLGLSFLARNKRNSRVGKKVLSGDGVIDCLSCHEPFISVWKANGNGNRICGVCKRSNAGYLGIVYD